MQVEVVDQYGNLITTDNSDPLTLSIAHGPVGGAFTNNSTTTATVHGGIASFGKLIFDVAGTYTLAASTTGGLAGADSESFTVNPGGVSQLVFSTQPTSASAGATISPAVQVELFDSFGNLLAGDNTDTVTLSLTDANKRSRAFADGSKSETTTVSGGGATFGSLAVATATSGSGSYTLLANVAGLAMSASSSSFTISPGAVYSFAVSPSVTQATAGVGFNLSIRARDRYGNTVTTDTSGNPYDPTVNLSCSDGQTVYPRSVALVKGTANPLITLYTPDNSVYLTARAGSISGSNSSSPIPIYGAGGGPSTDPYEYAFTLNVVGPSGNAPQYAAAGGAGPDDIPGGQTYYVIAQNDAEAQLDIANYESLLQQEDNLGVGSVITTVDPGTGMNSVMKSPLGGTFTPDDMTIIRDVTTTGTTGAAASFALTAPVSTPVDQIQPVTVTVLDANGNVVSDYVGTVTLSSTDPQFGQPLSYTFTPEDQGSHAFYVYLDTAGVQSLNVTQDNSGALMGQAIAGGQVAPQDSGSSNTNAQALVQITPQTPASLVINAPATNAVGSAAPITVTALDAFGNVVTNYTGTVSFLKNGSLAIVGLPSSYTFTAGDEGSHRFAVSFKTTGSETISVYDTKNKSLTSLAQQVQVTSAPAKLVIVSQPPKLLTAGQGFELVVEAVDSHGNVVTSFDGLVTLKLTPNPSGSTRGDSLSYQAVNGVADFVGLALNRAGVGFVLTASSGSLTAATTRAINVTANTVSRLVVISQPPGKVGAGMPFGLRVAAEDDYGNVISSFTGSVTLTLASGPAGAGVTGKLIATLVKGVATFSGLKIARAGTEYSLMASSGSLDTATTGLFSVTAGTATHLAVTTQPPSNVNAGSAFGLVVTALDAYGNMATSFTGKVTLSLASNPGLGTLTGQVTVQAVAGVATFTNVLLNNPGMGYILKAKSGLLTTQTDAFSVAS